MNAPNTITVEAPTAIISDLWGKWVAIPVKTPPELLDAAYNWCINQAGVGRSVSEEEGYRLLDLVVHDGDGGFRGDWLIRYGIDNEGGIDIRSAHVLAKVR
jgi:hypothetical protein